MSRMAIPLPAHDRCFRCLSPKLCGIPQFDIISSAETANGFLLNDLNTYCGEPGMLVPLISRPVSGISCNSRYRSRSSFP